MHFDRRRAALSSIVQTTMIRTHILFVGFSLIDEVLFFFFLLISLFLVISPFLLSRFPVLLY